MLFKTDLFAAAAPPSLRQDKVPALGKKWRSLAVGKALHRPRSFLLYLRLQTMRHQASFGMH